MTAARNTDRGAAPRPWLEAERRRVAALAAEGLSNGRIAAVISREFHREVSRNAVISLRARMAAADAGPLPHLRADGWTPARRDMVRALTAEGLDTAAIAARLGVTAHAVRMVQVRGGFAPARVAAPAAERGRTAPWPAERVARLRDLAAGDWPVETIALRLGASPTSVRGVARHHGIALRAHTGPTRSATRNVPFRPAAAPVVSRPVGVPAEEARAYDAAAGRHSLFDLTRGQCRFHIDDGQAGASLTDGYCGAEVVPGRSWCAHHALRVFPPRAAAGQPAGGQRRVG